MKTFRLTKAESAAYTNGERRFWREVKPGPRQSWLKPSTIHASPGGYLWTDEKGQLWHQFYHPLAGKFEYGVQNAADSPLTSIKCPFGTTGDSIQLTTPVHSLPPVIVTITSITVEQRDGRWGWVVEVGG